MVKKLAFEASGRFSLIRFSKRRASSPYRIGVSLISRAITLCVFCFGCEDKENLGGMQKIVHFLVHVLVQRSPVLVAMNLCVPQIICIIGKSADDMIDACGIPTFHEFYSIGFYLILIITITPTKVSKKLRYPNLSHYLTIFL